MGMRVWGLLAHYLAGKGAALLSAMWGMESPWHKGAARLLTDSLTATWEKALA